MKNKENFFVRMVRKFLIAGPPDYNLLFTIVFLNVYGIIMIYSASYNNSITNADSFVRNQFKYVVLGMLILLGLSFFNYHRAVRLFWGWGWGLIAFGVIFVLLTPLAKSELGATRWIQIGPFRFQAAEPVKAAAILFYAWYIRRIRLDTYIKQIIAFILALLMGGFLFAFSNNLSTAIILIGMIVCMAMITLRKEDLRLYLMLAGVLAVVVVLVFLIPALQAESSSEGFRYTRIRAWLHPEDYASDQALQAMQARYAIGAGGFWGKGLGQSLIKFKLPYAYNDFILAIICEELGVFGVSLMMLLFGYLLYRIYLIGMHASDIEGKIICVGVFSQIAIQLILNVMVVTSLFPTTGVTLPFFSAGGTSALVLLAELGLVLNVDKYTKDKRFREEAERYVALQEQRGGVGPAGWKRRLSSPASTKKK